MRGGSCHHLAREVRWYQSSLPTEPRGFHVFKTNQTTRNLRSALLLGAASAAAIGINAANAQQQGNVETVVVTGSRIPQTGVYAASPVTAVGQQELKFEGTTDV